MGIWRRFAQIKGGKGIPSYKSKKRSRIDAKDGGSGFEIDNYFDDPLVEENENAKELIIKALRQPYIPVNVFKSLTKMALSIMPENELIYFQKTIKWISFKDDYPYGKPEFGIHDLSSNELIRNEEERLIIKYEGKTKPK